MICAKALAVGPGNSVSVYIGQGDFENDCSLEMGLDYRLCAYDHENLITAAKHVLDYDNQWWIVDVYLTDNDDGAFSQL
jgi:predicted transposase YdaD